MNRRDEILLSEAYLKVLREGWREDEGDYPLEGDDEETYRANRQVAKSGGFSREADNRAFHPQSSSPKSQAEAPKAQDNWLEPHVEEFKKVFGEVYGIGHGGDGLSDEQINQAVDKVIDSSWGDEQAKAKEALAFLIKGFYQSGIQDS